MKYWRLSVITTVAVVILTSAACGSNEGSGGEGGEGDIVAAQAFVEPYRAAPTTFPITTTLETSVAGKKVAYLDCGTPVCGFTWSDVSAAAEILGLDLQRVNAGLQAESISSAFDSVVSTKADGVLNPALPNSLAEQGLTKLQTAGVPVLSGGVVNGDPTLMPVRLASEVAMTRLGELTAAYVVSENGADTNAVFYVTPELELTQVIYNGFSNKFRELCPGCKLRAADIPVAALGTNAPTVVTDDLQAHPDTTVAVFATGDQAIGLPTALKVSGITVDTVSAAPLPDTLNQIKNGDMKAGIGYDFVYLNWTLADALARVMAGESIDPAEARDEIPMQILTQDDITDQMVQNGWMAFPDLDERFRQVWPVQE